MTDLRQEHLARAKEVSYDIHAVHERPLNHLQGFLIPPRHTRLLSVLCHTTSSLLACSIVSPAWTFCAGISMDLIGTLRTDCSGETRLALQEPSSALAGCQRQCCHHQCCHDMGPSRCIFPRRCWHSPAVPANPCNEDCDSDKNGQQTCSGQLLPVAWQAA